MNEYERQQRRRHHIVVLILAVVVGYFLLHRSNDNAIATIMSERGSTVGRKRKLFIDWRSELMSEHDNYVIRSYNSCTEAEWRRRFRVSRRLFNKLVSELTPVLAMKRHQKQRHDTVYERELIGIALRRMGTRGEVDNVAEMVGRSPACVKMCTDKFCAAVVTLYFKRVVQLPTAEEIVVLCEHMYRERGLPQCWGAIDGKHWLHTRGGAEFACYKHANGKSITGLAVADSNYMCRWFGNLYCGTAGDGRLWNESHLKKLFTKHQWPTRAFINTSKSIAGIAVYPYLAGDSAFILCEYVLRLVNATRLVEKVFNGARQVAEQMWGHILNRFRCLKIPIELNGNAWCTRLIHIIQAAVCLHNLCILDRDDMLFPINHDDVVAKNDFPEPAGNDIYRNGVDVPFDDLFMGALVVDDENLDVEEQNNFVGIYVQDNGGQVALNALSAFIHSTYELNSDAIPVLIRA